MFKVSIALCFRVFAKGSFAYLVLQETSVFFTFPKIWSLKIFSHRIGYNAAKSFVEVEDKI
jgi:hypothetical protein